MRMSLSPNVFLVSPSAFPTSVWLIRVIIAERHPVPHEWLQLMRIPSVRLIVSYSLASLERFTFSDLYPQRNTRETFQIHSPYHHLLTTPHNEHEVLQTHAIGITPYHAPQKGLCPLVFAYFCRVTKVSLHEMALPGGTKNSTSPKRFAHYRSKVK